MFFVCMSECACTPTAVVVSTGVCICMLLFPFCWSVYLKWSCFWNVLVWRWPAVEMLHRIAFIFQRYLLKCSATLHQWNAPLKQRWQCPCATSLVHLRFFFPLLFIKSLSFQLYSQSHTRLLSFWLQVVASILSCSNAACSWVFDLFWRISSFTKVRNAMGTVCYTKIGKLVHNLVFGLLDLQWFWPYWVYFFQIH